MSLHPNTFNWSLIQAFLAVADTGSLSAAAERLGLSQPTLGRKIAQLEQDVGSSLFNRHPRGLQLSEKGAAMIDPARAMHDAMNKIALMSAGNEQALEGDVRITTSVFIAHHVMPEIIAKLRQEEPGIQIDLVPTDASRNLLYREADIAVRMYRPTQLDVVTRHIGEIELGMFASRDYLKRAGHPKSLEEFQDLDLIGYDRDTQIIDAMRTMGWPADRSWFPVRCDSHSAYWELVRAGCGVGFCQAKIGRRDPTVEELNTDFELPTLPIWLTAHSALRQTPRIRRVWDALAEGLQPFVS